MATAARSASIRQSLAVQVRAHFGLKQWELAAYLRVSRTLLAMVELGQRSLPAEALLRLIPFVQLLAPETPPAAGGGVSAEAPSGSPAEPPTEGPSAEPLEHPDLRRRLKACRYEAWQLRQTLAASLAQAEAAARFIAAVPTLLAAPPLLPALATPEAQAHAHHWIEDQRCASENVLMAHGPAARAVREVRLLALDWEAAELQRRLPLEVPE